MSSTKIERTNIADIIGFHLTTEPHGCFSNWFQSDFTYAGIQYLCVEQYMMAQKVALGQRYDLLDEIMKTSDPVRIKALGGKGYFTEFAAIKPIWDRHCRHIVKRGVRAKFMQNPVILDELLATSNALLAECAAKDRIWGIGINLKNPAWKNIENWNGSNYLGQILMEVREELRQELKEKGSVQYRDFRDAEAIPEWKLRAIQLKRFPQYYGSIHTYADQLPAGTIRDSFYKCIFESVEDAMRTNMGGGLPISGFYEMKQEIYEIAHRLRNI